MNPAPVNPVNQVNPVISSRRIGIVRILDQLISLPIISLWFLFLLFVSLCLCGFWF